MLAPMKSVFKNSRLSRDENGSILIFVMVVFSIMMLVGGAAVDLARYENSRATLQYNLDRAVLAAASLKQEREPSVVVQDYMSRITTTEDFDLHVSSSVAEYSRSVTASATADVDMWFLSMAGINKMPAKVVSSAQEKKSNLEISLVLDVSGSMASNQRLVNLKVAAKEFIDTMLADVEPNSVSISIIPFNSNTAPSQGLFDAINVAQTHAYTTCLDFTDGAFSTAAIDPAQSVSQAVFTSYYGGYQSAHLPSSTCNNEEYFEIMPYVSDAATLHAKIDSLQAAGNTAGHVGIKWGLALLDPKFQPVVDSLIADGDVVNGLTALPRSYQDEDTNKIIVMMSDGANTTEFRLGSAYNTGQSDLMEVTSSVLGPDGLPTKTHFLRDSGGFWYFDMQNNSWITQTVFDALPVTLPGFQSSERLDWADAWGHMSTQYYKQVTGNGGPSYDFWYGAGRNGAEADPLMLNTCEAAATEGVTVYTIGFEMNESSVDTLRDCASTPSHFYDANGTQISEVFAAIATSILKLKLTQ
ncbi:TadE/TadG family type IV pilus assembly protein [Amylibacter sp. IMCC11727]|uniref:TadE/TadG family type IV pilus assembly protein n=1 Tax=Amylibacter sp. IMCC11727 TaxID=3039851 RepID=UPI00244E1A41|nr:TadE/TadG family type IV pilus assembly protein [Amylibacter sp. IMCC11727]WGI21556.1 pilus assembly protein TadG-related protein [Amylibacter sp. IMCC11727]